MKKRQRSFADAENKEQKIYPGILSGYCCAIWLYRGSCSGKTLPLADKK